MQNLTTVAGLKNAIQILEAEHAVKGQLLKEELRISLDRLKPVNLLNSTLKDMASSPYLIDNMVGTAIGLGSGYLSKKIFIGSSGNMFRKLIGSFLQVGITNFVGQHSEAIKAIGQLIIQRFIRRKESDSKNPDSEA
jgi:hypothetical protein